MNQFPIPPGSSALHARRPEDLAADPVFRDLPDGTRRALQRLWALARPTNGFLTEAQALQVLKHFAGVEGLEQLLDAGLLCAWPGHLAFELITPAQRDAAHLVADCEAMNR